VPPSTANSSSTCASVPSYGSLQPSHTRRSQPTKRDSTALKVELSGGPPLSSLSSSPSVPPSAADSSCASALSYGSLRPSRTPHQVARRYHRLRRVPRPARSMWNLQLDRCGRLRLRPAVSSAVLFRRSSSGTAFARLPVAPSGGHLRLRTIVFFPLFVSFGSSVAYLSLPPVVGP